MPLPRLLPVVFGLITLLSALSAPLVCLAQRAQGATDDDRATNMAATTPAVLRDFPLAGLAPGLGEGPVSVLRTADGYLVAWVVRDVTGAGAEVRVGRIPANGTNWSKPDCAMRSETGGLAVTGLREVAGRPTLLVRVASGAQATDDKRTETTVLVTATDESATSWDTPLATPGNPAVGLADLGGAPAVFWCWNAASQSAMYPDAVMFSRWLAGRGEWSAPAMLIAPDPLSSITYSITAVNDHAGFPLVQVEYSAYQHRSLEYCLARDDAGEQWERVPAATLSGPNSYSAVSQPVEVNGERCLVQQQWSFTHGREFKTLWLNVTTNKSETLPPAGGLDAADPATAEPDAEYSLPAATVMSSGEVEYPVVVQVVSSAALGLVLKLTARPAGKWEAPACQPLGVHGETAVIHDLRMAESGETSGDGIDWVTALVEVIRLDGTRHLVETGLPVSRD